MLLGVVLGVVMGVVVLQLVLWVVLVVGQGPDGVAVERRGSRQLSWSRRWLVDGNLVGDLDFEELRRERGGLGVWRVHLVMGKTGILGPRVHDGGARS